MIYLLLKTKNKNWKQNMNNSIKYIKSISKAVTSRQDTTIQFSGLVYTVLICCILYNTTGLSVNNLRIIAVNNLHLIDTKRLENRNFYNVLYKNELFIYKVNSINYINTNCRSISSSSKNMASKQVNKTKDYTDLAIRTFIKGLFSSPPKFNLVYDFKSYSDIIDFIKFYKRNARISKSGLSNIKNRKIVMRTVLRTEETERFVEYVKTRYKNFDDQTFFSAVCKTGLNNNNHINNNRINNNRINNKYNYNYNFKTFLTNTIIFFAPSFIIFILCGCFEGSELFYKIHDLNNVGISQQNIDLNIEQNTDSYMGSYMDKNTNDSIPKDLNTNNSILNKSNDLDLVSTDLETRSYKSTVLVIALIVLIFIMFNQDGIYILQQNGINEGPYSPDTLRNTEDILAEIARRRSI